MSNHYDISTYNQLSQAIKDLMPFIKQSDVLALFGNLGTGKTTFTQYLLTRLGIDQSVTSPSYSLINLYETERGQIAHCDLYRLNSIEDALNLGIEEVIDDMQLTIVEWPEIIEDILPENTLKLHFNLNEGIRSLQYE